MIMQGKPSCLALYLIDITLRSKRVSFIHPFLHFFVHIMPNLACKRIRMIGWNIHHMDGSISFARKLRVCGECQLLVATTWFEGGA